MKAIDGPPSFSTDTLQADPVIKDHELLQEAQADGDKISQAKEEDDQIIRKYFKKIQSVSKEPEKLEEI